MSSPTLANPPPAIAGRSEWAVETHELTKRFGDNIAVDGVELLVPRGSAFGYLGPNGAGKTTLIRVLLGLTHADAGTMSLLGFEVPRHRDRALARCAAIVDEPRFHGHLTGRQNLQILAAAREPAAKGRIDPPRTRRHPPSGRRQGVQVLHGHAATPGRGRLPPRGSAAAHPRRADERPRPRGHARDARHDPVSRRRGAHGRVVLSPPRRGRAHLRRRGHRGPGQGHRQGPISQLLAGSSFEVQVECSDPDQGRHLLDGTAFGAHAQTGPDGLALTLPEGTERDAIAEINRLLVEGGISVYRLQHVQASLESWFLEVTKRLGEPE